MQFKSNFKCFQAIVRHGHTIYHPVTGTKTGEVKALVAEFGIRGSEYQVEDPVTGLTNTFADIRGFFFDSLEAQKSEKWTDDERVAVETRLLALAESWPEAVQLHSAPIAKIPFPTYAEVPDDKVAQLVIDLGIPAEALAYERENLNRKDVVAALEAELTESAEDSTEELTAV